MRKKSAHIYAQSAARARARARAKRMSPPRAQRRCYFYTRRWRDAPPLFVDIIDAAAFCFCRSARLQRYSYVAFCHIDDDATPPDRSGFHAAAAMPSLPLYIECFFAARIDDEMMDDRER